MNGPSEQQLAVWAHLHGGAGHVVVESGPGSGKTTTLAFGVLQLQMKHGPVLVTAFGREAKANLQKAVDKVLADNPSGAWARPRLTISTLSGLAYRYLTNAYPKLGRLSADEGRAYTLLRKVIAQEGITARGRDRDKLVPTAARLLKLAKANLAEGADEVEALISRYDLRLPKVSGAALARVVARTMELTLATFETGGEIFEEGGYGFDDLTWLAVKLDLAAPAYRTVLIDEAQDLDPAQTALILRAVHPRGRVVAFGDPAQGIFQFRGAGEDAFATLQAALSAQKLPLTISYRCARAIVAEARQFGTLEAAPGAPEGAVSEVSTEDIAALAEPGDFVLGRTNAAIVEVYQALRSDGIPARVSLDGSVLEYAQDFVAGVAAAPRAAMKDLLTALAVWGSKLPSTAETSAEQREVEAHGLVDLIAGYAKDLQDVAAELAAYDQGPPGRERCDYVWCATVHRAKGLEADRVFVLRSTFQGDGPELNNLLYVAITRARRALIYADTPHEGIDDRDL